MANILSCVAGDLTQQLEMECLKTAMKVCHDITKSMFPKKHARQMRIVVHLPWHVGSPGLMPGDSRHSIFGLRNLTHNTGDCVSLVDRRTLFKSVPSQFGT